jgi:hypothetical protein
VVGCDRLGHSRLDRLKIVGRQRPWQLEVVVEATRDGGPDAESRAREQVHHGFRHDVRRRVAHRIERVARLGVEHLLRRPAGRRVVIELLFLLCLDHVIASGESKRPLILRQDERPCLPRFHPLSPPGAGSPAQMTLSMPR